MRLRTASSLLGSLILAACGAEVGGGPVGFGFHDFSATFADGGGSPRSDDATGPGGGDSATNLSGGDGGAIDAPMQPSNCASDYPDQVGCACNTAGATRACYPLTADPKTRNVGACKDGMQTCVNAGEFSSYGQCGGAVTPAQESCTDGIDNNCDGLTDCKDPTCANDPACKPACNNGATRPCYDGPMGTQGVGACMSGTQTCSNGMWQMTCSGEVVPKPEICTDGIDNNCDGLTDCKDPTCANDPACKPACNNGATRSCYDGPANTQNVGTCKSGLQTCVNGMWQTTCAGEVLPTKEQCSDAKDHNCNGLPGCLDLFACLLDPACQGGCSMSQLGPGCVCPKGSGDTATCPEGYIGVNQGGGFPPQTQCCPCTASTCNNAGCCGETVCRGNPKCGGYTCKPLPAMCNGQVNADCDDFSEDCDEPCCKCTMCP